MLGGRFIFAITPYACFFIFVAARWTSGFPSLIGFPRFEPYSGSLGRLPTPIRWTAPFGVLVGFLSNPSKRWVLILEGNLGGVAAGMQAVMVGISRFHDQPNLGFEYWVHKSYL